jgi:hypothetical protein
MFIIDDELHAEPQGDFASFAEALAELRRRASIPWDHAPNRAPCMSWETCGRSYEIVEYDDTKSPWQEISRIAVLEITAAGIKWEPGFEVTATTT